MKFSNKNIIATAAVVSFAAAEICILTTLKTDPKFATTSAILLAVFNLTAVKISKWGSMEFDNDGFSINKPQQPTEGANVPQG